MELYVSWIPGLSENADAVRTLKECPFVDGIELCGSKEEVAAAQATGLRVSVHNPFRQERLGLQDAEFEAAVRRPELRETCAGAPVIGFHLVSECSIVGADEEVVRRCIAHLRIASSLLGPRVAFETTIYAPGLPTRAMTAPGFIAALLRETDAGLLFDTSHSFITAAAKARETGRSPEDILDEIIAVSAGRVVQLHCNVPGVRGSEYHDTHGVFLEGEETSERILRLARRVLDANPQLGVLTLEMYTEQDPAAHARIVAAQAELVVRRLGLCLAQN